MHDPLTLAFRIRVPFTHFDLVEVWHRDPESDGSDDSCGWGWPRLTKAQRGSIDCLVGDEMRTPWFTLEASSRAWSACETLELSRGVLMRTAQMLQVRVSDAWIEREAAHWTHSHVEGARGAFVFVPGRHCNCRDNGKSDWCKTEHRKEHARALFMRAARVVLDEARPWYRHPRWHVRHWQIRCGWFVRLWRRTFDRCAHCRERIGGEQSTSNWDGDRRWHTRCVPSPTPAQEAPAG